MTFNPFSLYIVQTGLAVTVLIALVLIVRRPVTKYFGAQAAYTLWSIPVLRLVLPPLPAKWTLFGPIGRAPEAEPIPHGFFFEGADPVSRPIQFIAAELETATAQSVAPSFNLWGAVVPSLFVVWMIGVLGILMLFYIRQTAFARDVLAASGEATPNLKARASQIQSAIGLTDRDIKLRMSASCQSPLVTGLVRPVILVPRAFEADYTLEEQHSALSHELMHIKRNDLWSLLGAIVFVAMQWFNPLAWFALKAFRTDQEAACDADVLCHGETDREIYGATLVKAARISRVHANQTLTPNLSLNHALYERLNTMTHPLPSPRKRKTASLLTATIGAAALIASACATSTAQEADEDQIAGKVKIITKTDVKSVFVNDEDGKVSININGRDLSPEEVEAYLAENGDSIQTIDIEQGDHATAVKSAHVLFLSDSGSERPDATEFANEMRRLAQDPVANASAMTALADDFEARMDAWNDNRQVLFDKVGGSIEHGTFTWHSDGTDSECGDQAQIRTIIVEKDDESREESRIEDVKCGTIEGLDADALIEQLRENSELSEERLEEVRERLENLHLGETGQKRVRVEIDPETTDD